MPLSKARDRARKKIERAKIRIVQPISNPIRVQPVQPKSVQPSKQELQTMIHSIERREPVRPEPDAPWYNPELHTTGDVVRMKDPRTGTIKTVTL